MIYIDYKEIINIYFTIWKDPVKYYSYTVCICKCILYINYLIFPD